MSPWASGDSLTPSTLNRVVPSWISTVGGVNYVTGLTDDGSTDGTATIQAALNLGGRVRLPPTTSGFAVSSLTLGTGVVLEGTSANSYGFGNTRLIQVSGATQPMVRTDYPSSSTAVGDRHYGAEVRSLSLTPLSTNTGVSVNFAVWSRLADVHVNGGVCGVYLGDVWDSDVDRVVVQSAANGCVIGNRGDIDNTNNVHCRHLHCESSTSHALLIAGTGTGTLLNNKLYFTGLKLEGLSGSASSALFRAYYTRNIHVTGGHFTFKGADSMSSNACAVLLDGDTIDTTFADLNLTNNGATAPFAEYIRLDNTYGNNSNAHFLNLDVRHATSSLLSGVVNAPRGSHQSMVFTFTRSELTGSLFTFTASGLARFTGWDAAGQAVTNLTVASDQTNDRSLRLVRSDRSDQWYLGRMQTSGTTQSKIRVLHEEIPVLSFEADNVVSINSGLRLSAGSLNLTAASLSLRTTGTSVTSSSVSQSELLVFVGGASGATLCLRSGGTLYYFGSSASTVG